jgi:hypothetical protein
MVQSVQQLATGCMTGAFEFEHQQGQEFSILRVIQNGSEAHPASDSMSTGGSLPRSKVARD